MQVYGRSHIVYMTEAQLAHKERNKVFIFKAGYEEKLLKCVNDNFNVDFEEEDDE